MLDCLPHTINILLAPLRAHAQSLSVTQYQLLSTYSDQPVSQVTAGQLVAGLRGVTGLVCDTSEVDPLRGLVVKGQPIKKLHSMEPAAVFWLLLTGAKPDVAEIAALTAWLSSAIGLPDYALRFIRFEATNLHPMTTLSACVGMLSRESGLRQLSSNAAADARLNALVLDTINLLANLPLIIGEMLAATTATQPRQLSSTSDSWHSAIADYFFAALDAPGASADVNARCPTCGDGTLPLDAADASEFARFLRLYLLAHCDHEGGNATALTTTQLSGAGADPYAAVSGGFNALAGPRHGLASQQTSALIAELIAEFGRCPHPDELRHWATVQLKRGRIIPGYGHAVLRAPDPRFELLHEFGLCHCAAYPPFCIASKLAHVLPPLLREMTATQCPWPNIDAVAGILLRRYGFRDPRFNTVMFALGMLPGLLAQIILQQSTHVRGFAPERISLAKLRRSECAD